MYLSYRRVLFNHYVAKQLFFRILYRTRMKDHTDFKNFERKKTEFEIEQSASEYPTLTVQKMYCSS